MKKIILLDDNQKNQREIYGASYVDQDDYADCLLHIEKINSNSDLTFLDDGACVLIHDSLKDFINGEYNETSQRGKDIIEARTQDMGLPYVLFSDGHSMTADWREESPDIVYSIKKSEFYKHLKDFLDNYCSTGVIDLKIIAFGRNYIKQLMWNWCHTLISTCWSAKDDDTLNISMIDNKTLRKIIDNTQPKIGISFNELMEKIDDGEVSVGAFRTNINSILNSFEKYGTNISYWK